MKSFLVIAAVLLAVGPAVAAKARSQPVHKSSPGKVIRRPPQMKQRNDPTEAEDLSQEAFIRAFRNLDLLVDPSRFAAWLRRIVIGVSIDWLRSFRPELTGRASALLPPRQAGG